MSVTIHKLKTWPEYFLAVALDKKTSEIRKNDRDFKVNDLVFLQEYDPANSKLTGREIATKITYLTDFEQKENYVVMSIEKIIG
ncbi:DUF3850 domain-containing protein [Schinkia azotoformans]|uniref:DUF3850 domain-containing protein n=1 Tax=Schinkia azotoformans TaxID=1454 RepID=UPI002E1A8E87|nr:DUF3850 domain-containing protein [Schinkia azotoformans]